MSAAKSAMAKENSHEHIRSPGEVARRCVILYAVLAVAHGESRDKLVTWLHEERLWEAVSPQESAFLLSEWPTQQRCMDATWRAEALFALLWSLDLIAELPSPTQLCDVQLIRSVLPPLFGSTVEFISSAKLRNEDLIHSANESTYRTHWRVRDAQLNGRPVPDRLNADVVQERHYAFNWLIGYLGENWDDIKTDT